MATKRLRVFAGPNGSGKTTIVNDLKNKIKFGVYVNADDIEKEIKTTKSLNFKNYNLSIISLAIQSYFKKSKLTPVKSNNPEYWKNISILNNKLVLNSKLKIDSYLAADFAEFIRQSLLKQNVSFTYETVMSHPEKINFLKLAKKENYRIYLYFISTEDPSINIRRVKVRVAQEGHNVKKDTITKRYYKSLENLKEAIKQTDRAFLFDNSNTASILISEITNGEDVKVFDPEKAPNWFKKYVVE